MTALRTFELKTNGSLITISKYNKNGDILYYNYKNEKIEIHINKIEKDNDFSTPSVMCIKLLI